MQTPPRLILDLDRIADRTHAHKLAFPTGDVHYAMKCNDHPAVLRTVRRAGGGFEIASYNELRKLLRIGVEGKDVLFSNPVKSPYDIAMAARNGVRKFAFDSIGELEKLAQLAPGSAVYARLATSSTGGAVGSEGKFGVDADVATHLLRRASGMGLRPYGVGFHVGSQMTDPLAWNKPIAEVGDIMSALRKQGIRLHMIDVGGGFPAQYEGKLVPAIQTFGDNITAAVDALPYAMHIALEPGRGLVADAGKFEATVIGVAERNGVMWAHLNVGAFNGVMESLESNNTLAFPIHDTRMDKVSRLRFYNVTGPTCDSQDTIRFGIPLSWDLRVGDTVIIDCMGAYSLGYASEFNGFVIPTVTCLERGRPMVEREGETVDHGRLLMQELGLSLRNAAPSL